MIVLKLGGSVITEKASVETLNEMALDRATRILAEVDDRLVVVHGAGSFGHHYADQHGVTRTTGSRDAIAAYEIHTAMRRLNDAVVSRFHRDGIPALPVHPLSVGSRDEAGELLFPVNAVQTLLGEGFVPVLHGDAISQAGAGVTILSGDEVLVELSRQLAVSRIGVCTGVPGVLDEEGRVIDRIGAFSEVADVLGASDTTDVTGGMAAKVKALLDAEAAAWIFDLDGLSGFFAGGSPGTLIGPSK